MKKRKNVQFSSRPPPKGNYTSLPFTGEPRELMASSLMLRFAQTTKDPHNTQFTLHPDGRIAINVYTELPFKEFTANTTIVNVVTMDEVVVMNDSINMITSGKSKPKSDEGPILHHQKVERVGEMDFYTFSERTPKVRLRGSEEDRNMAEYLERNGYGKKRRFVTSSGCAYTWVDFKLKLDDKREVGRYYPRKSKGLFAAKQAAYLEIERDRIADIGEIGFTLVCMLHESSKHAHVHV